MKFNLIKIFLSIIFVLLSACGGGDNNLASIDSKATTVVPANLQKLQLGDNDGTLKAYLTIDGDKDNRREMAIDPTGSGSASVTVAALSRNSHDITITYEYTLAGIVYVVAEANRSVNLTEGNVDLAFASGDYNFDDFDDDEDGLSNATELKAGSNPKEPTLAFITRWRTDNTGSVNTDATQIKIGTNPDLVYNYNINWGDGTTNEGVPGDIIHTYNTVGTYTIEIRGIFPQPFFGDLPGFGTRASSNYDASKLISIEQWGTINWQSMSFAFFNCNNLQGNAVDIPKLNLVTNMSSMFRGAAIFNQNISDWDVSSVTNLSSMFRRASVFNQNISDWNVSSVEDMSNMFRGTSNFNQSLSTWDVSSVTNMRSMFLGAGVFNQSISTWDVSSVTIISEMFRDAVSFNQNIGAWNISSVTNMSSMFRDAVSFNQNIGAWDTSSVTQSGSMFSGAIVFNQNISTWDVSSITTMVSMFANATRFDQDLSDWDVSSVTSMLFMFSLNTITTSNYDAMLIKWSTLALQTGVRFDAGNSIYSTAAEAAKNTLTTDFNWIISDGGLAQ